MSKECSICWESISYEFKKLACCNQHIYHKECLNEWILTSNSCPFCRSVVLVVNEARYNQSNNEVNRVHNQNEIRLNFVKSNKVLHIIISSVFMFIIFDYIYREIS